MFTQDDIYPLFSICTIFGKVPNAQRAIPAARYLTRGKKGSVLKIIGFIAHGKIIYIKIDPSWLLPGAKILFAPG
jgi:hypothetical protein